jgi:hypothetical protein
MLTPEGEIELRESNAGPAPPASSRSNSSAPLFIAGQWVLQNQTFRPLSLPPSLHAVLRAPIRLTRAQVPNFLNHDWARLLSSGAVEANFALEDFTLEPRPPRFVLELKGGLAQLRAILQCRYGARIVTPGVTARVE